MHQIQTSVDDHKIIRNNNHMYDNTTTWNPFKGCLFDCTYCRPSFQQQAKRQKRRCQQCYEYSPHYHKERLSSIPSAEIVFVSGNGDISFCDAEFTRQIIDRIKSHNKHCPYKTYYFQSKRPAYFNQFLDAFPANVILVTTLETNRDTGYEQISRAPLPTERYRQFAGLDYPRKVVTVEPLLDFDADIFARWIVNLKPEYVWLGFNSRPKQVALPEAEEEKVLGFVRDLVTAGINVRAKELRGLQMPRTKSPT